MIDTLLMKLFFNYLNPESDQHLSSPYSNTAESFIKIMSIKEIIASLRGFRHYTNSPDQF